MSKNTWRYLGTTGLVDMILQRSADATVTATPHARAVYDPRALSAQHIAERLLANHAVVGPVALEDVAKVSCQIAEDLHNEYTTRGWMLVLPSMADMEREAENGETYSPN